MDYARCQSCGLYFESTYDYGKNADGSVNEDYCIYCYNDGKFTSDMKLEDMIETCVRITLASDEEITREKATELVTKVLPTLKRWNKA